MAHVLANHKGWCKNIHGHSYVLHVTIGGTPMPDRGASDDGMLIDFSELKKLVCDQLLDQFDHSLVLSDKTSESLINSLAIYNFKIQKLNFQPTCENLVIYFAGRLIAQMPEPLQLIKLKLFETADSYSEWRREDNDINSQF